MRRTTLILIIILVVVIIGGGAYLWLMKDKITYPWESTTTNTNTASTNTTSLPTTNTATNTAPTIITLPKEIKGDTAASGTLKVGEVSIVISSQQKQATADGKTAEKGQTFLLVFFDAVEPAQIEAVDAGLKTVKLSDGKTAYSLAGIKVAGTNVIGDRGYMRFSIPETAKTLQLELGTGADMQTVKLQ